jgi:hypothetical protein
LITSLARLHHFFFGIFRFAAFGNISVIGEPFVCILQRAFRNRAGTVKHAAIEERLASYCSVVAEPFHEHSHRSLNTRSRNRRGDRPRRVFDLHDSPSSRQYVVSRRLKSA